MPEQEIAERLAREQASQSPAVQPGLEADPVRGVHQSGNLTGMKSQVILAEGVNDVIAPSLNNLGKVSFNVMPDESVTEVRDAQFHTRLSSQPPLLDGDALRQVARLVYVVAKQVCRAVGKQLQWSYCHHGLQ